MAVIKPFRGLRYNQSRVGSLDGVVAPPYDVISPEDQDWYYERHPYNIVRLILPKDNGNKYHRAAQELAEWQREGILESDPEPSLYVCVQEYEIGGEVKRRLGLICLLRLEDFSKRTVLPHESVLSSPLEDRVKTIRATKANLDSIFGLYSDGRVAGIISPLINHPADASAVDRTGVRCDLWRISDSKAIQQLGDTLSRESVLIADGHHRYTAALAYRDEMRRETGGIDPEAPYEYVMMTLVSLSDPGLIILPTHRLIHGLRDFDESSFLTRAGSLFDIEEVGADTLEETVQRRSHESHVYGVYTGKRKAYLVRLKPEIAPEEAIKSPGSHALKRLDVSILHSLLFGEVLGIAPDDVATQSKVSYTRDTVAAMRAVDSGDSQMLVVMNPTKIEEVREVAASGERMPQKSTFFYPKLLTGMVIRVMT